MWISPSYQDTDFPAPHSIDTKITLFEDRVLGWKLDIADQIINGSREQPAIRHAGYATLDIVFSYFEMIAKYEEGFIERKDSKKYFKLGVYSVFPEFRNIPAPSTTPLSPVGNVVSLIDIVLDLMYEGVRCGLYHSGITNGKIVLTGEIKTPMAFDIQNQLLVINPHLLVPKLKAHLSDYISRLRDVNNTDLRTKFEARYNSDSVIKGDHMPKDVFEDVEKKFPEIVNLMSDEFNSHEFILKLAQKHQKLYVQLLATYKNNNQPFQSVHKEIAKRLKKRDDLVTHIGNKSSKNIFGLENEAAVWRKVK